MSAQVSTTEIGNPQAAAGEVMCAGSLCFTSFVPTPRRLKYCSKRCAIDGCNESRRRPVSLTPAQLTLARELLDELLRTDGLRVALIPSDVDDRGMVRAVESANPKWFQRLSAEHQRTRPNRPKKATENHHTIIDRRRVVSALTMMVEQGVTPRGYGDILEGFIRAKEARRSDTFFGFDSEATA